MIRFKSNILLLLVFFTGSTCIAIESIPFENLDTKTGISLVTDIYRDAEDNLWIANNALGLSYFNTYQVISYSHDENDSTSISGDFVNKIYEDSRGNFWVGTYKGLDLFNRKTGKFKRYLSFKDDSVGISAQYVYDILEDNNGRLWVASGTGLYEYDYGNDKFNYINNNNDPDEQHFTAITIDDKGNLWLAGLSPGIYKFNTVNLNFELYPMNWLPADKKFLKNLYTDSEGLIWIGTELHSLAYFDPSNTIFKKFDLSDDGRGINSNIIKDIVEIDGLIYIATDQGGINIYDKVTKSFTYINTQQRNAGNLISNGIYCIKQDREGIIWVGTSRGGISYHNPQKKRFNTIKPKTDIDYDMGDNTYLSQGVVGAFCEDSYGKIWIGTDGGGINVYDRNTKTIKVFATSNSNLSSNIIRAISEDSNGDIWIATWSDKVNKYIRKEGRFIQIDFITDLKVAEAFDLVWSVKVDNKDRIWATYNEGHVLLFNKSGNLLFKWITKPYLVHYHNEVKFFDNPREYFILTNDGIHKFNEEKMEMELLIKDNSIISFTRDVYGNYWTGTAKKGAYCYDTSGNIIAHYNMENGLSNNTVLSMESSSNGMLWLATNYGLNQLIISDSTILQYYISDGLQNNQYFMQASLKTKDEKIFFGGVNGVDYFNPFQMQRNTFLPNTFIAEVQIRRKDEEFRTLSPDQGKWRNNDTIVLNWRDNILRFSYYSINYTYPDKTKYRFWLSGVQDVHSFIETSNNTALFNNVKPGEYYFKVIASNNDGIWNDEGVRLHMVILKPFWKKSWFYFVMTIAFVFLIIAIFKWRARILLKERGVLKQKVDERTKVITDQNLLLKEQRDLLNLHSNKLEDLVVERTKELELAKVRAERSDSLKSSFLANLSHEIRTPMNAIVGFSSLLKYRKLSNERKEEYVSSILENSESLLVLIDDILDYSLIESKDIELNKEPVKIVSIVDEIYSHYSSHNKNEQLQIYEEIKLGDHDLHIYTDEQRIRQILQHLMNNGIKFTAQGYVKIGIERLHNLVEIYVEDTGPGIDKDKKEEIFERFIRLERDDIKSKRGIGLGLSISRKLARLLGGDLYVESEQKKGSRFVLVLPGEPETKDS